MTDDRPSAVYDCVVYIQALINAKGPAGECVARLLNCEVNVFASDYVLLEILDAARRPNIADRFGIVESDLQTFVNAIRQHATIVNPVPHVYDLAADFDDSHYLDLAIAMKSPFVVSRDRHLLRLMNRATPEATDFRSRFPGIQILTPPQFLDELRSRNKPR